MRKSFGALLLCLVVSAFSLHGQSEMGGATLNGVVTDPSGAAIAGARITAREQSTGFERSAISSGAGLYSLLRLPVGVYDLAVEQKGFQLTKRTRITLNVGAVVTLDVQL